MRKRRKRIGRYIRLVRLGDRRDFSVVNSNLPSWGRQPFPLPHLLLLSNFLYPSEIILHIDYSKMDQLVSHSASSTWPSQPFSFNTRINVRIFISLTIFVSYNTVDHNRPGSWHVLFHLSTVCFTHLRSTEFKEAFALFDKGSRTLPRV
jgi:hypothetical protein